MALLKKENWFVWLLINFISQGLGVLVLGAFVDAYDKNAWYAKPQNWIIGLVLCLIPALIMMFVFMLQMTCAVAAKLKVPGKEYYLTPYIWIVGLIIPFLGWFLICALFIYLEIAIIVQLANGQGEQYIR